MSLRNGIGSVEKIRGITVSFLIVQLLQAKQPTGKIGKITSIATPRHFGKCSQTGQQHMLDLSEIDHIFPPYISLHAQYALSLTAVETFVRRKFVCPAYGYVRNVVGSSRGDRFPFDTCRIMRLIVIEIEVIAGNRLPCRAASMPPRVPRHDMTVASCDTPPSRISSQPIRRRPRSRSHSSIRRTK